LYPCTQPPDRGNIPHLGVRQAVLPVDLLAAAKVDCNHLQVATRLAWVHEVSDAGVQAAQHKVVGLDVTVADGALVAVGQELQDTLDDAGSLLL
jgi:hypothetical protein